MSKIDIALRDIILVFTPILLVNIWSWYKDKKVKKSEVDMVRKTFINELQRIETKLDTQINLIEESKDKFHVEPHYFGIESFNPEISWLSHSKILYAFVNNSKYIEAHDKSFSELMAFTSLTSTFESFAGLKLTLRELREFVNENIKYEKELLNNWRTTYERFIEQIISVNKEINSGNLKINTSLQKNLSDYLIRVKPDLSYTTVQENKNSLNSFLEVISETERLSMLIPISREMLLIIIDLEGLKPHISDRLDFYYDFMIKCKSNIHESVNLLQTKTKIKRFWQIN